MAGCWLAGRDREQLAIECVCQYAACVGKGVHGSCVCLGLSSLLRPCHTRVCICVLLLCRALALKQISSKDMWRVVLKEAGAGCMMGEWVSG